MTEVGSFEKCGIDPLRCTVVNPYDGSSEGRFVLYWMQASIRHYSNASLEYAAMVANELSLPLVVCFVLTASYPNSMYRHLHFLDQGLSDVSRGLKKRGIRFLVRLGSPPDEILKLTPSAAFLVTDCGYIRTERKWRRKIYEKVKCPAVEIEDNVVVPVEVASDKEEYSARTIRPKITKHLDRFLKPIKHVVYNAELSGSGVHTVQTKFLDLVAKSLDVPKLEPTKSYKGGETEARSILNDFIENKLSHYDKRNDPNADVTSHLSPYIHFGMISPIEIALKVMGNKGSEDFLEQLIIRRELGINFVYYNSGYDDYKKAIPSWARATLKDAASDKREYTYTLEQLEAAQTHDPAWNAAQRQMVDDGYMSGYMRMYWGKKVIEWTKKPKDAFDMLIYLNNKYELDGRDPNGYCGVAWCFGKHDRPWTKRPIFGTVRYMNYAGLKRKFDIDKYCREN
ncbi:MAG: deoxyribodipyrimidine photo-lyase [Sedimentisphaeraceae bacterium JB056]